MRCFNYRIQPKNYKSTRKTKNNRMGFYKHFDTHLIIQSIPSLLLSLIGLCLSGRKLDIEQNELFAKKYPILLLSNCMLSFKGNAELIFTMHLSSFSQKKDLPLRTFLKYAFENSCLVLAQSIIIGLSIGLLGFAKNIISNIYDFNFLARITFICLFSAILSSLLILLILVPSVIFSVKIGINPDNIVLPIISAFGDYLDIIVLIGTIKKFQYSSKLFCFIATVMILLTLPCLIYVSLRSKMRVPIQSFYILMITYFLSTTSSYAVQILSRKHLVLASSTPIFCGLTGSITYIYLNKRVTSLQNSTFHNRRRSYTSLFFISILIAGSTTILMPILGVHFKRAFSFLFVAAFVTSVCILLKVVEVIIKFYLNDIENVGVVSLPLITSIADFLGTTMTILTSIIVDHIK